MAEIIVDESTLLEPNLMTPQKGPRGPVKYNENWGGHRPELLWLLNGRGTTIHDYSGNGNHGEAVGSPVSEGGAMSYGTEAQQWGFQTPGATVNTSDNETTLLIRCNLDNTGINGSSIWESYTDTNTWTSYDAVGSAWNFQRTSLSPVTNPVGKGMQTAVFSYEGLTTSERIMWLFIDGLLEWGEQVFSPPTFSGDRQWQSGFDNEGNYIWGGSVEMIAFWSKPHTRKILEELSKDPYILFEPA